MKEYSTFEKGRTFGVSLTVGGPTGQYDQGRIINFGANRWSFKPELGYTSVRGHWILEIAAGVWLFTNNTDGFGDVTVRQEPIASGQGHISYNFSSGWWLGLDGNYFAGGRTTAGTMPASDLQQNTRIGLTLSIPLKPKHSLQLAAHSGAFTRIGADFDAGSITYQVRF
jgi:hypothetical protein